MPMLHKLFQNRNKERKWRKKENSPSLRKEPLNLWQNWHCRALGVVINGYPCEENMKWTLSHVIHTRSSWQITDPNITCKIIKILEEYTGEFFSPQKWEKKEWFLKQDTKSTNHKGKKYIFFNTFKVIFSLLKKNNRKGYWMEHGQGNKFSNIFNGVQLYQ